MMRIHTDILSTFICESGNGSFKTFSKSKGHYYKKSTEMVIFLNDEGSVRFCSYHIDRGRTRNLILIPLVCALMR